MFVKCYNCFQDHDGSNAVCPHCGFDLTTAKREVNHLPRGTVLSERYIIGEVCGFGGFGITYKAWDKQLDSIVAVKEYFPNGIVNRIPNTTEVLVLTDKSNKRKIFRMGLERYMEEARTTAKYVSHRNIVNVFNFFEENNTAYIVMEFLDGITLEDYLQQDKYGRMDIETAVDIILGMCNALKTIHADGIVHRDISPDNIFICVNDTYKLYDFGAARFAQDESRLMTIILKPGFAPPEQYEKVNIQGPWTDIYALGGTLYMMLTGVKPVVSLDRKVSIERNNQDELPEPISLNPEIPQYLNDTIMKAMALDRNLRFQKIEEFEEILKSQKPVEPIATTIKKNKNKRVIRTWSAVAAALLGIGALGYFVSRQLTPDEFVPADITVCYRMDDDTFAAALTEVRDKFCEKYPDVTVELLGINTADYAPQLKQMAEEGDMPALFQSDSIDTADYPVVQLKSVLSEMTLDNYYFLDANKEQIRTVNKLPLAFNVPVFYMNSTRCDYEETSVTDLSDIIGADVRLSVDFRLRDVFDSRFSEDSYTAVATEEFFSGKADLFFSDTSRFFDVQKSLPARFKMLTLNGNAIQCSFSDCWSLGERENSAEEITAQYFLEFMLSDVAQDIFYIRHKTGAFPINRNALDEYTHVYPEFSSLASDPEIYVFDLQ